MRVGFSSGHVLLSKIIKKLTRSKASHSYIVFTAAGQELVIQANIHGVCCQHYENFKKQTTIVAEYELTMTPEQEQRALQYALMQLLKPYDFCALIGFGWILINKMFGRKVKQPFRNKAAYYCSELIITSLQVAPFPLSHMFDREVVSPEDLIEFLDVHPNSKLVFGTHHQA